MMNLLANKTPTKEEAIMQASILGMPEYLIRVLTGLDEKELDVIIKEESIKHITEKMKELENEYH